MVETASGHIAEIGVVNDIKCLGKINKNNSQTMVNTSNYIKNASKNKLKWCPDHTQIEPGTIIWYDTLEYS